ncbi:NAD(+) hydrolase sarm1-like isoform X3 [Oratosquilla oratoria]|uniref:NAD(+) hydrolase sarm1-like isoform X3 n=1 Tax=Oratosquilla oratoria TaxID=337810 RepID=UPI003F76860E
MKEVEEKKRGWSRDPNGGWIRESTPQYQPATSPTSSHNGSGALDNHHYADSHNGSSSNSLRNRRRTCSSTSIPNLCTSMSAGAFHSTPSPAALNSRGSMDNLRTKGDSCSSSPMFRESPGFPSGSPRVKEAPYGPAGSPRPQHSRGFWVQEPDDVHTRWVPTETPDLDSSSTNCTPLVWPPTEGSQGGGGGGWVGSRRASSSQPPSPHKETPPLPSAQTTTSSTLPKMAGEAGDGGGGGGGTGTGEVLDRQNRFKRMQQEQLVSRSSSSQMKSALRTSSSSSHLSASSSNKNELKSSSKSNLSELKSSMSEFESNISEMTSSNSVNFSRSLSKASNSALQQSASSIGSASSNFNKLKGGGSFNMGSMDALNDALNMSSEQLALPDVDGDLQNALASQQEQLGTSPSLSSTPNSNSNTKELKFEQKTVTSSSKKKVVTDKNSYEEASGTSSESRKMQTGDVSYEESSKKAASKAKLEMDGVTAEKAAAVSQEARQLRAGDVTHREGTQLAGATMKLSGEGFSAHKSAVSEQQQRQTVTPVGSINQETMRQSASSGLTINTKGVCTKQSSSMSSSQSNVSIVGFDDLGILSQTSQPGDVQKAIMKYSGVMSSFVEQLSSLSPTDAPTLLENINEMMRKAWSVPTHGQRVGSSLCNVLRDNGGLDILIDNCMSNDDKLKFSTAKVLEQCLTTDNRGYVVENGLKNVVNVACDCTKYDSSVDGARVGTGILEHLFKHNERTCSDIIKLGGLDAVLYECRKKDVETLRHCAGALANLSLYGGSDNHQAMIQQKVPVWLFPLAFHTDDNIKYYAFLAIAALVANKEIEAAVLKSETLNLVEPFVTTHLPDDFANSNVAHRHGQSPSWLQRLVPVLNSKREEARNLAAFHFCMEAGIKKRQGNIEIFHDIGAIEPLRDVASSPNAISSKYAAQALRLIGEEVPHKLSQQVPLWSVEDVSEWVKQIGFAQFMDNFLGSRVDGDLLLQLSEIHLQNDIGITNGILRRRFLRELRKLKMIADYSSCDSSGLNTFLTQIDTVFAEYTYKMIEAGVSKELLRYLTDDQLLNECGIFNSIHRQKVQESIRNEGGALQDTNVVDKNLDVFISYRRSNGSQLASLLKVHLQLKLFSVFIDVERLEAGKFDNNLLNSIRQAKNFILVLTPNALDRCIGDTECKDWVHREIVAALQSGCEIIPIIDNFQWPEPEQLPEDMRAVCTFNGVRWIHDYQDACVEKLERFMRGEGTARGDGPLGRAGVGGMATPVTPSTLVKTPHIYQRTTSTESGKGSACSDKDFAKD